MRLLLSFIFVFAALVAEASDLDAMVAKSINSIRSSSGLKPLRINPKLQAAARSQAVWMARAGRMEHLREPAKSPGEFLSGEYHPSNRVVKAGYFQFDELFRTDRTPNGMVFVPLPPANDNVGEIIAKGVGGPDAYNHKTVVEGWMRSPGHRKEILKECYREFGANVCSPRPGETYWCVVFAFR
jgi:uncharacterized protein YkwD